MKNLNYNTTERTAFVNGAAAYAFSSEYSEQFNTPSFKKDNFYNNRTQVTRENLLTPDAYIEMATGMIPDLWNECRDLFHTFFEKRERYSALQFIPVLERVQTIGKDAVKQFFRNRKTRHVLVDNNLLKVVLIHWKPGKVSTIHGHPKGGCAFKVLQGKLEELRYSADSRQTLLSSNSYRNGAIGYIDDMLGHHAVGNPFGSSAISLHAYTPGRGANIEFNF